MPQTMKPIHHNALADRIRVIPTVAWPPNSMNNPDQARTVTIEKRRVMKVALLGEARHEQ